jgi:hypothetical protein
MGTTQQSDVTLHLSGHQHHHWLFLARVPYSIGSNHPRTTYRAMGHNVTAIALCYKRLQWVLECSRSLKATKRKKLTLEQYNSHFPVDVGYYAPMA